MNKQRRLELEKALKNIHSALDTTANVLSDEEIALDSIPENLQSSDRYSNMENNVDQLNTVIEQLEDVCSIIEEVIL